MLLDANVLIALTMGEHVHHAAVQRWLASSTERFATCPITEGSLVRLTLFQGRPTGVAHALLRSLAVHERHEFWPDDVAYCDVSLDGVIGHRQVTDAYLVHLARAHGATLATLDGGLAALHGDAVVVVPTT